MAHSRQVWQHSDRIGNGAEMELAGLGLIHLEPDIHQGPIAAVAVAIGADLAVVVALGVDDGGVLEGEGQGANPQGFQGVEFARIGEGIAVAVQPDLKAAPALITPVDLAIAVAVEVAEGGEAMGRQAAITAAGGIAEQFGTAADLSITLEIPHQDAIASSDPAAALGETIAVVVEMESGLDRQGDHPIAVKVEHQR